MILVSGADGFIGRHLVRALIADGETCRLLTRSGLPDDSQYVADVADRAALSKVCADIECIFHCAGHAHAFSSRSTDEIARHWQVNFQGTKNLLEAAGRAGVKRFVFLSSVKAMAEPGGACVDEDFPEKPNTAYGQSKLAAEQAVLAAGQDFGMHVVNLRLSMVYGRGGRGNLNRMAVMVKKGLFPPLPETANHRSLVHVDDVVSAMRWVAGRPAANGQTYIVAAPEAPSGRAIYDALRAALTMPPCAWSVPPACLRAAARLGDALEKVLGRALPFDSEVLARLLGSAWYSAGKIERELGWRARVPLEEGLSEMLRE